MGRSHRPKQQRPWWQRIRGACVIVAAVMAAGVWTLRLVREFLLLYGAGPWL
ncbi:hypothetical protein ACWDYK_15760 [Streptomyces anthocyanicus]|uniref:hypothetical protein n=1 Tax=Streptomyces anthocyanicus TaxID=68174 RepID=UPI002F91A5A0|nr:hypothetical protein OHA15_41710 [Streptomyces anthocyanicus]